MPPCLGGRFLLHTYCRGERRKTMDAERKTIASAMDYALTGHGAHASTAHVFDGVDWKQAGTLPAGAPHSLYQLLHHMSFWQDWALRWLEGKKPATPKHASESWPAQAAPTSAEHWRKALKHYQKGLHELERNCTKSDLFVRHGDKTAMEMIQAIASHNSYHAGQAAFLRRAVGAWPPPAGGVTW